MTSYSATSSSSTYDLQQKEAWWVQQWIDLLNSYRFKKRLERGRQYARDGHILSLEFKGAKVSALVQGTAPEPYKLSIWIDAFSDEDWNYVIDILSGKAIYSAYLLAGEMPADIESVFTASGLSLFPFTLTDVHSRCSCPDPKNPCKHIAAVYYQLGDFFREDPFVLFQLRGRTKTQILETLRQKRQRQSEAEATPEVAEPTPPAPSPEQLLSPGMNLDRFWVYEEPLDSSLVVISPAESTVLDVLGPIPLPSEDAAFVQVYLKALYGSVSQKALADALGN